MKFLAVSEAYFNAKYTKNPVNLIHRCHSHDCKPQPRYRLAPEHKHAVPHFKYLAHQQCLPGNVALNKSTSEVDMTFTYGVKFNFVSVTNDISCKAYDGENVEPHPCSNSTTQNSTNPTTQKITPKPGKLRGSS